MGMDVRSQRRSRASRNAGSAPQLGLESQSAMAWELLPEQSWQRAVRWRQAGASGAWVGDGSTMPPCLWLAADSRICGWATGTQDRPRNTSLDVSGDPGTIVLEVVVEALALAREHDAKVRARTWPGRSVYNLVMLPFRRRACSCPLRPLLLSPPLAALLMATSFDRSVLNALFPCMVSPLTPLRRQGPCSGARKGSTAGASRPCSSSFAHGCLQWAAPAAPRPVDQPWNPVC